MCFSNLPIEFDEEGDPYLADDAEAVDRPGEGGHDHAAHDCGCGGADAALDEAPEEAFEQILASVTDATRTHLTSDRDAETGRRDSAEGD